MFIPILSLLAVFSCSEYDLIKRDQADIFYQLEASEVDILLVVDNSCSMSPYQEKLSQNFDTFLTFFVEGNIDYQIGVTTTTVQDNTTAYGDCTAEDVAQIPAAGQIVNDQIITPATTDASSVFADLVNVGVCGNGYEMGLEAASLVLQNESSSLIRDDAYLSVVFVSDEQDASPLGVNDYLNAMHASKDADERQVFNGSALVVNDVEACSQEQIFSGATEGSRYIDFAEQANGLVGNICSPDFSDIVQEISLRSSRLNDTFVLKSLPSPSSLLVAVGDEAVPCDGSGTYKWTYDLIADAPTIIFDRTTLPPPDSAITVEYDLGSGDPEGFCSTGEE